MQHFTLASNGNLHRTGGDQKCFALLGGAGPALTTWACNTGKNEVFTLSGGKLCSKTLGGKAVPTPLDVSLTSSPVRHRVVLWNRYA